MDDKTLKRIARMAMNIARQIQEEEAERKIKRLLSDPSVSIVDVYDQFFEAPSEDIKNYIIKQLQEWRTELTSIPYA